MTGPSSALRPWKRLDDLPSGNRRTASHPADSSRRHRLAARIRDSRWGVTGSSVTAPTLPIASSMALDIAAPTALMPPSPVPLIPSGLRGLGASSVIRHSTVRRVARRRHQIVGQGNRQRVARFAVGEFLQQRAAKPLHAAPDQLPTDHAGVDAAADVVGNQIALHHDLAGRADRRAPGQNERHREIPGVRC